VLSALPVLLLTMSGIVKLLQPDFLVEGFNHLGYDPSLALYIGIVELLCVLLYLIPPTAVLGAILITGYMGGAIATHVRLGEPFIVQIVVGVLVWLGLFLREPRLRVLLPIRR
jgi:uncharacterized membrane protein YphA (DoxX/SURF4 family)